MKNLLLYLLILTILSACSSHKGSLSATTIGKNAVFEDVAVGVSQSSSFLNIGGLKKEALIFEAKTNLYRNRPLKANEEYANFTVDFQNIFIILYRRTKVTVTADVLLYKSDTITELFSENYRNKTFYKSKQEKFDDFRIGDSVLTKNRIHGKILSFEPNSKIRFSYVNHKNEYQTKKIHSDRLFSKENKFSNLKYNDTVIFKNTQISQTKYVRNGILKGFKKDKLLVHYDKIEKQYRIISLHDVLEVIPISKP
jgi:hypothetical protein